MIIFNIILSLTGWIAIIVLHKLSSGNKYVQNEILADGNNLFKTCFFYIVLNVACEYIHIHWLQIILCILMLLFALPPTFSSFTLLFNKMAMAKQKISALLCSIIPLMLGADCLYYYVMR